MPGLVLRNNPLRGKTGGPLLISFVWDARIGISVVYEHAQLLRKLGPERDLQPMHNTIQSVMRAFKNVSKYQSCMDSKLPIICEQTVDRCVGGDGEDRLVTCAAAIIRVRVDIIVNARIKYVVKSQ